MTEHANKPIPMDFADIPPLSEDLRIDRVWRFIAIIFLAHAGVIDLRQDGQTIWVSKHETDTEGCSIPGEIEEPDGLEGLAC
jgi:chromatin segregation and condensation protein Rec8/ScpA/Scc1 (kleisin family)